LLKEAFKKRSILVMDGTFKFCPTLFNQLFVIHGSVERGNNKIVVLLVYALMTSRDQDLYIQLFTNINNFAVKNGIYFNENSNLEIITDFELASINAIHEMFNFAIHSVCFFHFTQSIYR